jgi:glycosyltransferase involved in cell wall biosynthesis
LVLPVYSKLKIIFALTSKYSRMSYQKKNKKIKHLFVLGDCGVESYEAFLKELYNDDHGTINYDTVIMQSSPNEELMKLIKDLTYNNKIYYLVGNSLVHKDLERCSANESICAIILANKLAKNPKISVIIPIYKSEDMINKTIKSVQNQNMLDIEIILVNDFSTDNSLLTIQRLKVEDPRIKIINNEKNMGILYSRSIAVLEAKGKYILNLDHDDFFFDERLFDELYEEAEEGNFDIVSFMDLEMRDYNTDINNMRDGPCTHHPDNFIVLQPELPYYPLFRDDHFDYVDIQIWGKLFKTETYKKAVNLLGKERYSTYNIMNEDCIGTFSICRVSESYKYMRRYGLFHFVGGNTAIRRSPSDHSAKMILFFSDIIFELSKNEYKYYSILLLVTGPSYLNEDNKKILKTFVDKIMKCNFIDDKYKTKIKDKYPEIMESYNLTK